MEFTHLDKVLFPKIGATKGQMLAYYDLVADRMMPHLKERPLILQRFPEGVSKEGFFQQNPQAYFPKTTPPLPVRREKGKPQRAISCRNKEGLLYLANLDTIAFHTWLTKAPKLDYPDKMILDLDPGRQEFKSVIRVARTARTVMRELGLEPLLMTTGGHGLHLVVPLKQDLEIDLVRQIAELIAEEVEERLPKLVTREVRKAKRRGRLFLDVLRNAYGHSAVAPYSLRAYPTAPIATPIAWEELGRLRNGSQSYHLGNIARRLSQDDPWSDYNRHRCSLRRLQKSYISHSISSIN
jgi:bifunctional non-homologous end joining protein LigD